MYTFLQKFSAQKLIKKCFHKELDGNLSVRAAIVCIVANFLYTSMKAYLCRIFFLPFIALLTIYLPVGKFIQHFDQFIDEPASLWPTSVGHVPGDSGTPQHKVGLVRDHLGVPAIIRLNVTVHFDVNSCQNGIKCSLKLGFTDAFIL